MISWTHDYRPMVVRNGRRRHRERPLHPNFKGAGVREGVAAARRVGGPEGRFESERGVSPALIFDALRERFLKMLIRLHQSEITALNIDKNDKQFVINLWINEYGEKALLEQLKTLIKKEAKRSCANKRG